MEVLLSLSPFLCLAVGTLLLMLVDAFSKQSPGLPLGLALTFLASAAFSVSIWFYGVERLEHASSFLSPWLLIDRTTLFLIALLCLGGCLSALLAGGYLKEHLLERGEFYPLLAFSTFGALMTAAAGDMLTLFLGLETMSIGAYAMIGYRRGSLRATEAALKYFLLGSFAAAIMLYGIAFLYGATGHTDLAGLRTVITQHEQSPLVVIGLMLLLVGLLFKVSAVPFHMWTPDAYEGAPTPSTAFMAIVVKGAAFAMILRTLLGVFGDVNAMSWAAGWPPVLGVIAFASMTFANLIAARQESVKRMLAYSSIAHAGYILVGVLINSPGSTVGSASVLFYLTAYTVSTAGAFGSLIACGSRNAEAVSYQDLAGLGRRHPMPALAFSFFILSLAGIPPTAGFLGKWFILQATIQGECHLFALFILLNSVLAAYYYLRVIVYLYMKEPNEWDPVARPMHSSYVTAALVISAILVIALGISPSYPLALASAAAVIPAGG
ncbi:NADH-quinone oxidoreductase subunit N [Pajaroellobacter abortibovis]|uniref:NADH-quinone oxidoreductase subunit N n=1 Tax=Pajaroellobacter abortibovis TaxID=1882918 RepID=A0A1L6MXT3_9BACT|nr:NADH-quinone oxidoreductase subunit N [Pajaroellobacter abortibovis]APS00208.1 NADH-quinone oxidoreductase subunit N [Pajaroellobacter abortibovis]